MKCLMYAVDVALHGQAVSILVIVLHVPVSEKNIWQLNFTNFTKG